ncbi:MAG: M48 family metalloprotease [Alphaproteobacteria bacterium]
MKDLKKRKAGLGASWIKRTFVFVLLIFSYTTKDCFATFDLPKGTFISDDETEAAIILWLEKIFQVAGLSQKPLVSLVVNDEINAATIQGGRFIIFTGLITKCQALEQLLAVLAHEVGHLAGSHVIRAYTDQQQAHMPLLLSILLGGAASLASGNLTPLIAGTHIGLQVAERSILKYSRTQEEAADSAALKYLNQLKWPIGGLIDFLDFLDKTYRFDHQNAYTLTHPLTRDRKQKALLFYSTLKEKAKHYELPEVWKHMFDRIKAKILAFTTPISLQANFYKNGSTIPYLYYQAIIAYRKHNTARALELITKLLQKNPKDPYFLELGGQICFDEGRFKDAINNFKHAFEAAPKAKEIPILLAQALIESSWTSNSTGELNQAINILRRSLPENKQSPVVWRLLAKAYGRKDNRCCADVCLAEEAWLLNDKKQAKKHAEKGIKCSDQFLKRCSEDILLVLKDT